jgi:hypothetical protein
MFSEVAVASVRAGVSWLPGWTIPCGGVAAAAAMIGRLAAAIRSESGRRPVAAENRFDCATME